MIHSLALPIDPTCCLCHSVWYAASAWCDSLNGYISAKLHKMCRPRDWNLGLPTAVDEVMMKTPPSGFALNVGSASLKRYQLLLTFVDQHWEKPSDIVVYKSGLHYPVPVIIVHSVQIAERSHFGPTLDGN
jgi:hypothetical protein